MRTLLVGLLLLGAIPALACDCAPPPEPKKALEQSAAVLLADVARIDQRDGHHIVTLKVQRWWKGGDSADLVVTTASNSAACGYLFQVGGRYLIYTDPSKDKLHRVTQCSRTAPEKAAEKAGDFKELGEGKAPAK